MFAALIPEVYRFTSSDIKIYMRIVSQSGVGNNRGGDTKEENLPRVKLSYNLGRITCSSHALFLSRTKNSSAALVIFNYRVFIAMT